MQVTTINKKPWLNDDGSSKSESELREACKSWKPKDWEEYLQTCESSQRELTLKDGKDVELMTNEDYKKGYLQLLDKTQYPLFIELIRDIVLDLRPREKQIVEMIYWKEMRQLEVARE